MAAYRLSRSAQSDIESVLAWSQERFGTAARRRYQGLIAAAIRDVAAEPGRADSRARPELGDGVRSWHLRRSRGRSRVDKVQRPRHIVFYRYDDGIVIIGRVLHDEMDVERHLDAEAWE